MHFQESIKAHAKRQEEEDRRSSMANLPDPTLAIADAAEGMAKAQGKGLWRVMPYTSAALYRKGRSQTSQISVKQ